MGSWIRAGFAFCCALIVSSCASSHNRLTSADARHSGVPLSPLTALQDVKPAPETCAKIVKLDVARVAGTKPTQVWALKHNGFVATTPGGLLNITYFGESAASRADACRGRITEIEYRSLSDYSKLTLHLPKHWSIRQATISAIASAAFVSAIDQRGLSLRSKLVDVPTLIYGENDLLAIRYRRDTCDKRHYTHLENMPVEFMEFIKDGKDGPEFSGDWIQVEPCTILEDYNDQP